jgi:selenocysteine-specific elongation factor
VKRLVIGTAGHVDHGKTALVRALTGIDTDRLEEEKRRGITIELGFAHLTLPDGTVAGVVDVPGHERFVRSMAAGAGGVDLVILVVAADEGVMPQTREHLDICRLLGVPRGVVAITKADLLPGLGAGWLQLLEQEIRTAATGTFLEEAPIVAVSANTGEGLDLLREAIAAVAAELPERLADGPLLLPLDRAFSLKGFGTVVTGTLFSGQLGEGETVALCPPSPGAERLRVRSIQIHGAASPRALAGQRTAVNLPGIEPTAIHRGQALVRAGELHAARILDAEVTLLAAAPRPLGLRSRLLLHAGTAQVPAVVALLDREELAPGATALVQIRLGQPIAALPGQRFILRGSAALDGRGRTLAGGRVLALGSPRRRRGRPESLAQLQRLSQGDVDTRVLAVLELAGPAGLAAEPLSGATGLGAKGLQHSLERLSAKGEALLFDRDRRGWVAGPTVHALEKRLLAAVDGSHVAQPLAVGIGRETLRASLPPVVDPRLFQKLLVRLEEHGELLVEGDHVRRRAHAPGARGAAGALKDEVARALADGALKPPWTADLPALLKAGEADVTAVLKLLAAEGRVVRSSQELYFDAGAVEALRVRLVAFLRDRHEISTQEFKELVGASRKYAIPLAEYFDRERVTLRVGERRVLRGEGRA